MYLNLRWHGIHEVRAYDTKSVYVSLPPEVVDRLAAVKAGYKVPYSQIIRRAIFYLKASVWNHYKEWTEMETYDERLPKYKGYIIREQLDEKVEEALLRPGFDPGIQFLKLGPGRKEQICFRMTIGDVDFLDKVSKGKATLSECVSHLIKKNIVLRQNKDGEWRMPWITGLIIRYKPHRRITFAVRQKDDEAMDNFKKRYKEKYDEVLKKSEIVELAYRLFKQKGKDRQLKIKEEEQRQSKRRGKFKKVTVSFSYEGRNYWEKHVPVKSELRAALYHLLNSKKFNRLVDND